VKKILFISLALIMALSIGLVGCDGGPSGPVAPPTKIIVGTVRDLTGPLSFYDKYAGGPVYRAFNKTLGAGIFMSVYNKTLPVELIIRPYNFFLPGDLATQTAAVITSDKANFVWGGPGTGTIYVQAPICNTYGRLLITLEGGATDMMRDPAMLAVWPNTFVNLAFSDWYEIPVLWSMLKDEGVSAPKAFVLYFDNEHGQEYKLVTEEVFGAGNVTSVGHTGAAGQPEITTIVNQAITALNQSGSGPDYDVFCAFTYDPYLGMVMTAFNATGFDPPGIIMGPGANTGTYLQLFGPMMEGIRVFAVANNKTVITENVTMPMQAMYDLTGAECSGLPPIWCWDPWGHPTIWAGLEMWKVAVETVGHLNAGYTTAMRNVLASFNSTNPCTTVIGNTWYRMFGAGGAGGGVMDYLCMPGQVGQWQSNYVEIVGASNVTAVIPKYSRTANVTYPMTGMWGW